MKKIFLYIFILGVSLIFGQSVFATSTYTYDISQPLYDNNFGRDTFVGTNFTPSVSNIGGVDLNSLYNTNVNTHICYGDITNATEASTSLENCLHLVPSTSCSLSNTGTSTCLFDKNYSIISGNPYHLIIEYVSGSGLVLESILSNVLNNAELFSGDQSGYYYSTYDLTFTTFEYDQDPGALDVGNYEIIEEDWTPTDVFVSSQFFTFQETIECVIASSCPIKFWYSEDDVGSDLYFLEKDETDVGNYIDFINGLDDKVSLYDYVYPTVRSSKTIDYYMYFLDSPTASSSLYQYTKVYWVEKLSENEDTNLAAIALKSVLKASGNIFPVGLIRQLGGWFEEVNNELASASSSILLSDFIPTEYESYMNSDSVILSTNYMDGRFPLFEEKIYPAMETFLKLLFLLIWIVIILPDVKEVLGIVKESGYGANSYGRRKGDK